MDRAHSLALALSVMPGEQPVQLHSGGQFTALFIRGTNRGGGGNGEYCRSIM
jgi:hypothetical protein